jgi:hypothetical protein
MCICFIMFYQRLLTHYFLLVHIISMSRLVGRAFSFFLWPRILEMPNRIIAGFCQGLVNFNKSASDFH